MKENWSKSQLEVELTLINLSLTYCFDWPELNLVYNRLINPISSRMGLSTLPSPSDGLLCIIMSNTAVTISLVRCVLRSFLHVIGVRRKETMSAGEYETAESYNVPETNLYMEEFRYRTPRLRFKELSDAGQDDLDHDCRVCLTRFESESEVTSLPCRHVYHKECVEKWIGHWNITCPLCRTPMMDLDKD
ncbi:putative E3 ubiquitin-protein ligase XERICO [Drosera capensis]